MFLPQSRTENTERDNYLLLRARDLFKIFSQCVGDNFLKGCSTPAGLEC